MNFCGLLTIGLIYSCFKPTKGRLPVKEVGEVRRELGVTEREAEPPKGGGSICVTLSSLRVHKVLNLQGQRNWQLTRDCGMVMVFKCCISAMNFS